MAVTPAILILILSQSLTKMLVGAIVSTSRGRFIESSFAVYRDLRSKFRDLERDLVQCSDDSSRLSSEFNQTVGLSQSNRTSVDAVSHQGKLMSHLYRIHKSLLINSLHFESNQLKQLQVCSYKERCEYNFT